MKPRTRKLFFRFSGIAIIAAALVFGGWVLFRVVDAVVNVVLLGE